MKRLSTIVALIAVLALAGTASAAPTFSGSASLSVTGTLLKENTSPYPSSIGSPSLTLKITAQDGSNWSLNGTLTGVNGAVLDDWKLSVNAGSVRFNVAENQSVGSDKQDLLGLLPAASGNPGNAKNHLRVEASITPFSVIYDKVQGGADRVFVEAPAGAIVPASLGVTAKVNVPKPTVVGYTSYKMANGIYLEAAAGMTSGNTDAVAYGAELTIPVTPALSTYLVAKRFGTGFDSSDAGKTATLVQLTYTQPQYKAGAYIWRKLDNATAQPVGVRSYGYLSLVQVPDDNRDWFNPDTAERYSTDEYYYWGYHDRPGTNGYRSLKGLAAYVRYGQDGTGLANENPNKLHLAVGAPLVRDKVWANAYAQLNGLTLEGADYWARVYAKLTPKLASETKVKIDQYTVQEQTRKAVKVLETFTYTVSGSSSVVLKLDNLIDKADLTKSYYNYTLTFNVSF